MYIIRILLIIVLRYVKIFAEGLTSQKFNMSEGLYVLSELRKSMS